MTKERLPKVALGFIIRRCTLEFGRRPNAREFSQWANSAGEHGTALFGRPVTEKEAEVILRHQGRPVTARSARAFGAGDGQDGAPSTPPEASADIREKVVDFAAVRASRSRRGG